MVWDCSLFIFFVEAKGLKGLCCPADVTSEVVSLGVAGILDLFQRGGKKIDKL